MLLAGSECTITVKLISKVQGHFTTAPSIKLTKGLWKGLLCHIKSKIDAGLAILSGNVSSTTSCILFLYIYFGGSAVTLWQN